MHDTDLEEIKEDVKSILKLLNGNGKIGMCAKVELMWNKMNKIIAAVMGVVLFVITRFVWEVLSK